VGVGSDCGEVLVFDRRSVRPVPFTVARLATRQGLLDLSAQDWGWKIEKAILGWKIEKALPRG